MKQTHIRHFLYSITYYTCLFPYPFACIFYTSPSPFVLEPHMYFANGAPFPLLPPSSHIDRHTRNKEERRRNTLQSCLPKANCNPRMKDNLTTMPLAKDEIGTQLTLAMQK